MREFAFKRGLRMSSAGFSIAWTGSRIPHVDAWGSAFAGFVDMDAFGGLSRSPFLRPRPPPFFILEVEVPARARKATPARRDLTKSFPYVS